MARAPWPQTLPGSMAIMFYSRDEDSYSIVVDDEERSSYKLGNDVQALLRWFKRIGFLEVGTRLIDQAHEFQGAVGNLKDNRVSPVRYEPQRGNQPQGFRFNFDSEEPVNLPVDF